MNRKIWYYEQVMDSIHIKMSQSYNPKHKKAY